MPALEVEWRRGGLVVGKTDATPVVAAEFEFWRHNPLYWESILDLIKASGIPFVSTFVCWDFHEVSRSRFDFTGETNPSRDLAGFLDACWSREMRVLLRVGPIIDAEWPTRGPAPDSATLERLDPYFLERTKEYFAALDSVVRVRLVSAGGPIAMIGLDSEFYFPYSTDPGTDTSMGGNVIPYAERLVLSLYRSWLEKRYSSAEDVGIAWSRPEIERFAGVGAPDYATASRVEILDSFEFIESMADAYFGNLREATRDMGWDVPHYTNMKYLTTYLGWGGVGNHLDLVGADFYPPADLNEGRLLTCSWYLKTAAAVTASPPWLSECQAGSSIRPLGSTSVTGVPTPDQGWRTSALGLALGARGFDYFMFVERDDWHYSPISPIGKARPHLAGFRDAARVGHLMNTDAHVADVGLIWSLDEHREFLARRSTSWLSLPEVRLMIDGPLEFEDWWAAFATLHRANLDFDLVCDGRDLDRYKVLVLASRDSPSGDFRDELRDWERRGGRLLMVHRDGNRAPDSLPATAVEKDGLTSAIRALGIESAASVTGDDGAWTCVYRDSAGFTVFAINTLDRTITVEVALRGDLGIAVLGGKARDCRTGEEWMPDTGNVTQHPVALAPHDVAVFRVERAS